MTEKNLSTNLENCYFLPDFPLKTAQVSLHLMSSGYFQCSSEQPFQCLKKRLDENKDGRFAAFDGKGQSFPLDRAT